MIQLTCTSCRRVLDIDDGFAGGVCRCQFCGTIQTVPAKLKGASRPATPIAAPVAPKALYKGPEHLTSAEDPDLDGLAQAVASSGLAGSGLRSRKPASLPPAAAPTPEKKRLVLIVAGAAAGVLLAIIVIILLTRGGNKPTPAQSGDGNPLSPTATQQPAQNTAVKPTPQDPAPPSPQPVPTANGPSFMNLPLAGPSIIYILDRGDGTRDSFDAIKGGAWKSIRSLGSQTKFQIIFWETTELLIVPKDTLVYPTPENIEVTRTALKDVFCFGQSKIEPALDKALAQNPAEIVIATGKLVDDSFAKSVLDVLKNRPVKIHTASLGAAGPASVLKQIAEKTGGRFVEVPDAQLAEDARETP